MGVASPFEPVVIGVALPLEPFVQGVASPFEPFVTNVGLPCGPFAGAAAPLSLSSWALASTSPLPLSWLPADLLSVLLSEWPVGAGAAHCDSRVWISYSVRVIVASDLAFVLGDG